MRNAEKDRPSSCPFADAIALKVKDEYLSKVPQQLRLKYKQTGNTYYRILFCYNYILYKSSGSYCFSWR